MASLLLRPTAATASRSLLQCSRPLHTISRPLHTTPRPLYRSPRALGLGLGLSIFALTPHLTHPTPSLLRSDAPPSPLSRTYSSYEKNAATPLTKGGRLNAKAVRQISLGSICGLLGGLAVSVFSKPLALLIGVVVFGVQTLESRGISIVPYTRLQGFFKNTNIKSAVRDNAAFKICFGATFALASFGEF